MGAPQWVAAATAAGRKGQPIPAALSKDSTAAVELLPTGRIGRRGRLVRRSLVAADVIGLSVAFLAAQAIAGPAVAGGEVGRDTEVLVFLATLPLWITVARLYGIYGRDEQRADHSTVDDLVGVFHLVTIGSWLFFAGTWISGAADPNLRKIAAFWFLAIVLVVVARSAARALYRRHPGYVQRRDRRRRR